MKPQTLLLLFLSLSTLSCRDMGTEVNWSEWQVVKYENISFSAPPHTGWFFSPWGHKAGEGWVDVDGDDFLIWLLYGSDLEERYNTWRDWLTSELRTTIDGHAAMLAHFSGDPMGNDGPQLSLSVFISDVGDGKNQFLMLILHRHPSKEYISELIAHSIRVK